MADLKDFSEQFEAWWLTKFSAEFLDSDNCWSAWTGWQARGELDAKKIKELEQPTQEPVLYIDGGGLDGEERMNKNIVITVLLILIAMSCYKLAVPSKGSPCAVEVKYANSKATYVGYSL